MFTWANRLHYSSTWLCSLQVFWCCFAQRSAQPAWCEPNPHLRKQTKITDSHQLNKTVPSTSRATQSYISWGLYPEWLDKTFRNCAFSFYLHFNSSIFSPSAASLCSSSSFSVVCGRPIWRTWFWPSTLALQSRARFVPAFKKKTKKQWPTCLIFPFTLHHCLQILLVLYNW